MAKKTRTPPPPRRPVQAPQRRETPHTRPTLDLRRRRQILYGVAAAGIAGLVAVVLAIVIPSGASAKNLAKTMAAAGCTLKNVPPLPPTHPKDPSGYHADVPTLTTKVKWSTFPPSAGGHYPLWAVWNFYTQPVNPRQVVHNEEHGGVIIWWGPNVPKSTVDKLAAFYQASPVAMLGTPIAGLGDKIALTAWTGQSSRYYRDHYYGIGHVATCSSYNEKAFKAFRDAYRGNGPEGIPMSADQPGTGPNG